MSSRHSQQDSWLRIPLSVEYWKVVGIFLVYFSAFAIGAAIGPLALDDFGLPILITIVFFALVLAVPLFVLVWGAVLASREIRRRTAGYRSTPEGLILTLIATCVAAGLLGVLLTVSPWPLTAVSLPFAVWTYLGILRRRLVRPVTGAT